jgi:hypothetical protein
MTRKSPHPGDQLGTRQAARSVVMCRDLLSIVGGLFVSLCSLALGGRSVESNTDADVVTISISIRRSR